MKKINKTAIINFLEGAGARRLATVVSCLLVIAVAWLLSGLIWSLLDSSPDDLRAAPPVVRSDSDQGVSERDLQQLVQRPLFGDYQKVTVEKKENPTAERKETSRPLVLNLLGIVYSPNPLLARAVIQEQGKEDGVFAIGSKISDQATLEQITQDSVYLILQDNTRQVIALPDDKANLSQGATADLASPQEEEKPAMEEPDPANFRLASLREELITNPERIIEYIRFAPVSRGRQFLGFRVSPGRNTDAFQQIGLRNGDVITAVDQVPMDSPQRGFEVVQKIASAQQLELTVTRGGKEQNITIRF